MPKSLTSIIVAVPAALALLVLGIPALLKVGQDSSSWAVPGRTLQAKLAWKANSAGLTYFAFAPGGRYFYTVSRGDKLSVFTAAGKTCYTVSIPGCDRLAPAPDATYSLAYKHRNPADSTIVFLDSEGPGILEDERDRSCMVRRRVRDSRWDPLCCRHRQAVRICI